MAADGIGTRHNHPLGRTCASCTAETRDACEGPATVTKIVLVPESIRRDSLNASVLPTVRRLLAKRADGEECEIDTLPVGRLPLYGRDVEQACGTDAVHAVQEADMRRGHTLRQ
ncbi:hypothetical protein GCM10010339_85910 [Streptomyces alanosinicus]|uniref:Uncharacterized protein n=1 Tax=Streptomyces alanosinicus TaxID=68171 RepID=A0A919D6J6_9ACTN|nr:hypothetical protein GCM10010339_85910 [Streptomyces alanosinicus]